jgi:hypothetical protein
MTDKSSPIVGPDGKPGYRSSELWLAVTCAGVVTEAMHSQAGLSLETSIACVALAMIAAGYSIARALAKRS